MPSFQTPFQLRFLGGKKKAVTQRHMLQSTGSSSYLISPVSLDGKVIAHLGLQGWTVMLTGTSPHCSLAPSTAARAGREDGK